MAEPPDPGQPYVFLSYTSPDRARVLGIADALEATGIRVWVDRREIVGGSSWNASIVDAITHCTAFALTCSARSLASPNVQQEVQLAWEEQRPILPVLLEQVTIPRELRYPLAGPIAKRSRIGDHCQIDGRDRSAKASVRHVAGSAGLILKGRHVLVEIQ